MEMVGKNTRTVAATAVVASEVGFISGSTLASTMQSSCCQVRKVTRLSMLCKFGSSYSRYLWIVHHLILRSLLGCDRLQLTQVLVNCRTGPYHETPVKAGVKPRLAKSCQKQHAQHSQKSSAGRKMPCETKREKV